MRHGTSGCMFRRQSTAHLGQHPGPTVRRTKCTRPQLPQLQLVLLLLLPPFPPVTCSLKSYVLKMVTIKVSGSSCALENPALHRIGGLTSTAASFPFRCKTTLLGARGCNLNGMHVHVPSQHHAALWRPELQPPCVLSLHRSSPARGAALFLTPSVYPLC